MSAIWAVKITLLVALKRLPPPLRILSMLGLVVVFLLIAMRALDLIAAFVPSQVEREADELEHWRPRGSGSPSETNRRARLVPELRAFGEV